MTTRSSGSVRGLALAGLAAVLVVASPAAARAETVVDIVVAENDKTNDATVIAIAGVDVGDEFSYEMLDRMRIELVSSGLFKDVEVFSEPVAAQKNSAAGVKITIIAKDKHSWVIAPTFYNQPGNIGGGVGFGESNLFGRNKKVLLYGQIATADSFFLGGYLDPSLAGTRFRWRVDTFLRREKVTEFDAPTSFMGEPEELRRTTMNYLNGGAMFGLHLFADASFDVRLRGAYVFYDDPSLVGDRTLEEVTGDPASTEVPEPGVEGWDVSTELVLEFDRRANWYGITTGNRYRLAWERSLSALGSDFDYWHASLVAMRAHKFFSEHNLIIEGSLQYGDDLPFQQEYTSGGTNLRGYSNRQFRGNVKAAGSVEYSVPLFKIKSISFRGLTFYDTAYTTFVRTEDNTTRNYLPNHEQDGATPWKNGVGAGFRLYARSIVLPLLGLDVGYGLEAGDYQIYFAVGLTDL